MKKMTTTDHEFAVKKLYDQSTNIDEGKYVFSRMIACSYVYPGALSRNTSRCRTTIIYENLNPGIDVVGGTVEKWSDKGWQTIDEYFDTNLSFFDVEEALDYLLKMYKAFVLGLPHEIKEHEHEHDPFPSPVTPSDKKPNIRVLSFKEKFDKEADKYSKEDKKETPDKNETKDSEPDDDWV